MIFANQLKALVRSWYMSFHFFVQDHTHSM